MGKRRRQPQYVKSESRLNILKGMAKSHGLSLREAGEYDFQVNAHKPKSQKESNNND